ncbi:MAG: hypothetical protein IJ604_08895 [Prevotella sp.]|nr:hypothetical protein [Prevotella sp.]
MSEIRETIELRAPKSINWKAEERLISRGHCCPECHGNGWFWGMDPQDIDSIKAPCRTCNGTGKVDAVVTVHWQASEGKPKV